MSDAIDPKEPAHLAARGHPPPLPIEPPGSRGVEPTTGPAAGRTGRAPHPTAPLPPAVAAIYGLVRQKSQYSVRETARRLTTLVHGHGFVVLGDIDFAGDAGRAGLSMRPMRQIVFGNPRIGMRLVVAAPTVALDLPQRVLIFEEADGTVWLAYNDAEYLRERHQLPDALVSNISCAARARCACHQRRANRAGSRFQGPLTLVPGIKGDVNSGWLLRRRVSGAKLTASGPMANSPAGVRRLCGCGVWCGARCSQRLE